MNRDVTVVTGAGGIGTAIARRVGNGRTLVMADAAEETLAASVAALTAEGFDVAGRRVDVSSRDSVHELAHAAADLGPVTQIVHTAGLSPVQAGVEAILRVDLLGVALVLDEFADVVAPGGSGVVVASMAGHMSSLSADEEKALSTTASDNLLDLSFLTPEVITTPAHAYMVAKRANALRVRAASIAWGRKGARVNSVSPGVISTTMGQAELASESGDVMRMLIEMSGTRRIGTPQDIADAVAFLLGPTASFVTGTDLLVDGGVIAATSNS